MTARIIRNLALSGLLVLASAPARSAPPGAGSSELGGEHDGTVTARLVADVAAVAPGDAFRAGVEITMAEGWHTYWENGGDAGLPTTIECPLYNFNRTIPVTYS